MGVLPGERCWGLFYMTKGGRGDEVRLLSLSGFLFMDDSEAECRPCKHFRSLGGCSSEMHINSYLLESKPPRAELSSSLSHEVFSAHRDLATLVLLSKVRRETPVFFCGTSLSHRISRIIHHKLHYEIFTCRRLVQPRTTHRGVTFVATGRRAARVTPMAKVATCFTNHPRR